MQQKYDEIVSIECVGEHETYDITVDNDSHTFFANEISVSNCSHATAYAIDSYWCAWLLKHHEIEWLTSYLEHHSTTADKRFVAFSTIKKMGYQVVPIDINEATASWTSLPGKRFMPSLLSCKGVGNAAVDEIISSRPYSSIEDVFWNETGEWRPSKFNKRALESLVKIGAFGSFDAVGEGKMFSSVKQMHHILVENNHVIKKTSKRDPLVGKKAFYDLLRDTASMVEWTPQEKAQNMEEVFGAIDVMAMVDQDVLGKLTKKGIASIDDLEEVKKDICWFVIGNTIPKRTKNGKQYLIIEALGPTGKAVKLFCWGWNGTRELKQFTLCIAECEKNDFGCSTMMFKLKELT